MKTWSKQVDSLKRQILEETEDCQRSEASEIQSIMGFIEQYDDWISNTSTRAQKHEEFYLNNHPSSRGTERCYKILEDSNWNYDLL